MECTRAARGRLFVGILVGSLFMSGATGCSYPGSPAHAKVNFNTETIQTGTVVTYNCEFGFDLLGPSRRLCLENGTWIPPGVPVCVLNVAVGKAAMQSSVSGAGTPQLAVDGNSSRQGSIGKTCTLTKKEANPWWYVNLLEPFVVQLVRLDLGPQCCPENPATNIVVRVGNNRPDVSENPECNKFSGKTEEGRPLYFPCTAPLTGAFVSVHIVSSFPSSLSICEAYVYTDQVLAADLCPRVGNKESATATYNGKCYTFYSDEPRNFEEARQYCGEMEGSLVHDTSPALQGFLSWELYKRHRKTVGTDYWNGAVWQQDTMSWTWYDGREVTLSFWSKPSGIKNCSKFDSTNGWLWTGSKCDEKLNFICQNQPISCGIPGRAPNSTMFKRTASSGSQIVYQCDPGHMMVGSSEISCMTSGFYSNLPPTCVYLECGIPANVVNGGYMLLNGTRFFKSAVQYFCYEGYILVGRSLLTCESDQKWDGPPPRCDPASCHSPPTVEFGNVTLTISDEVNSTSAEYSCDSGFLLTGAKIIRCNSSGVWVPEVPRCRGGIISLGIFGGFVFLAVIISIVVIIIRRNSNSEDSVDSLSTYGTGDSRERLYEQQQQQKQCCDRYPPAHTNRFDETISATDAKTVHAGNTFTPAERNSSCLHSKRPDYYGHSRN